MFVFDQRKYLFVINWSLLTNYKTVANHFPVIQLSAFFPSFAACM